MHMGLRGLPVSDRVRLGLTSARRYPASPMESADNVRVFFARRIGVALAASKCLRMWRKEDLTSDASLFSAHQLDALLHPYF